MFCVRRALDKRLDRPVASREYAIRFIVRFAREARTMTRLDRQRICTLHDVGPNYLVMELVEGGRSRHISARLRRMPLWTRRFATACRMWPTRWPRHTPAA